MRCTLPIAISKGSCSIEFSNSFLRRITISLEHKDVLEKLVVGRNTPFRWNAREFITASDDQIWLSFGSVEIFLTEADAADLCECVDKVVDAYISTMMDAEDLLEAWNRPLILGVPDGNECGHELLTISVEKWKQVLQYAKEISQSDKSEYRLDWNYNNNSLTVLSREPPIYWHTYIHPKPRPNSNGCTKQDITLMHRLYYYSDDESWKDHIGVKGIWTVEFTKNWLLTNFLQLLQNSDDTDYLSAANPNVFWTITDPHLFEHHVVEIRDWVRNTGYKPTNLFIGYCEAVCQLLHKATINYTQRDKAHGMIEYLLMSEARMKGKSEPDYSVAYYRKFQNESPEWDERINHPANLFALLHGHLTYFRQLERIDHRALDYLLTAHELLFRDIKISTTQSAINKFKKTLWPLYEQASIETRCKYINNQYY